MEQTDVLQPKERIILWENNEERTKTLESASKQLEGLQRPYLTFKEYFNLKLPLDTIWEHATNPADAQLLIKVLLYEQNPDLKKLPIPRHKAIEFIELPQGYYAYMES